MSIGNPVSLPQASARLVDGNGFPTREFYRFFQSLASIQQTNSSAAQIAALQAAVTQLQEEIDNLPDGHYPTLRAIFPIVSYGLLQNGFAQLVWKGTTDDVPEGTSNLYYTDDRVRAVLGRTIVGFAFGDASPRTIYAVPDDRLAFLVRLVIDTPFDGAGATLSVGTASDAGALMPADANDPATDTSYEFASNAELALGDSVQLTINPGSGATQGSGRLILDAYQR